MVINTLVPKASLFKQSNFTIYIYIYLSSTHLYHKPHDKYFMNLMLIGIIYLEWKRYSLTTYIFLTFLFKSHVPISHFRFINIVY